MRITRAHVGPIGDDSGRDARLLESLHGRFRLFARSPSRDVSVEFGAVADSQVERAELWLVSPRGRPQHGNETIPFGLSTHADGDPAVVIVAARPASVDSVRSRRMFLRSVARWRLLTLIDGDVEEGGADDAGHAFELREVKELAAA